MTLFELKWKDKLEEIIGNIKEKVQKLNGEVSKIYRKINELSSKKSTYKEDEFKKIYNDLLSLSQSLNTQKWFLEGAYTIYNCDELEPNLLSRKINYCNENIYVSIIDYCEELNDEEEIIYFKSQEELDSEYEQHLKKIEQDLENELISTDECNNIKDNLFLIYAIYIKHAPTAKNKALEMKK